MNRKNCNAYVTDSHQNREHKILRLLLYDTWHIIEAVPTEPLAEILTSKGP